MKFLTREWLKAAELDFRSANQLLQDESLTSVVTFHCQQTIEKLFKAVLVENGREPQRIHDLLRLYKLVLEFIDPFDDILVLKLFIRKQKMYQYKKAILSNCLSFFLISISLFYRIHVFD